MRTLLMVAVVSLAVPAFACSDKCVKEVAITTLDKLVEAVDLCIANDEAREIAMGAHIQMDKFSFNVDHIAPDYETYSDDIVTAIGQGIVAGKEIVLLCLHNVQNNIREFF